MKHLTRAEQTELRNSRSEKREQLDGYPYEAKRKAKQRAEKNVKKSDNG